MRLLQQVRPCCWRTVHLNHWGVGAHHRCCSRSWQEDIAQHWKRPRESETKQNPVRVLARRNGEGLRVEAPAFVPLLGRFIQIK